MAICGGWSKSPLFAETLTALGVSIDVVRFHHGVVIVSNTDSRPEELVRTLEEIIGMRSLKRLDALRFRGRIPFASTQLFGRLGKRCLALVTQHAYGAETSSLAEGALIPLSRFRHLMAHGGPRSISIQPARC